MQRAYQPESEEEHVQPRDEEKVCSGSMNMKCGAMAGESVAEKVVE